MNTDQPINNVVDLQEFKRKRELKRSNQAANTESPIVFWYPIYCWVVMGWQTL